MGDVEQKSEGAGGAAESSAGSRALLAAWGSKLFQPRSNQTPAPAKIGHWLLASSGDVPERDVSALKSIMSRCLFLEPVASHSLRLSALSKSISSRRRARPRRGFIRCQPRGESAKCYAQYPPKQQGRSIGEETSLSCKMSHSITISLPPFLHFHSLKLRLGDVLVS